jgi:hypothetical protein
VSPLFYTPEVYSSLKAKRHVNVTAIASQGNLLTKFMGIFHWMDISLGRRNSLASSRKLLSKVPFDTDPDISTGGNCINFNNDDYYYSDHCLTYEKNFFKLFANIQDKNSVDMLNLDFLSSWTLGGPFATLTTLKFMLNGGIEVNSTFRYSYSFIYI